LVISPARNINLTPREPDRARALALVATRRSSASLNDNFVDIGFFQQLAPNGIEPGSPNLARFHALHMGAIDMQDASSPNNASDQRQNANRNGDGDNHDRVLDLVDFDLDFIGRPHIRESRILSKNASWAYFFRASA
jgi:hypothetical protein